MPSSEMRLVWAFDDYSGKKRKKDDSKEGGGSAVGRDFCTGDLRVELVTKNH